MPVYKLLNEMPYDEFLSWLAYFDRRPIDWRDDLRTAYLLRIQGDKRNPTEIFPTLQNVFKKASNSDDPLQTLRGSAMFHYMLKSRNGDKLNL